MGEYRNRTTGEVLSQGQVRAANTNMSLPRVWTSSVCDALNVDPVLVSPAATTSAYQTSVRDGVEQNANGDWVEKYVARDMFADIEGGQTKAEQEAAYQTQLDTNAAQSNRSQRNNLLQETDWWAVSDRTMTSAQSTYRAALRDLPTHSNWPNLEDNDWPTKP